MDRMMYVRKPPYYRMKYVWEAYYRMKYVWEALYHISTHELRTYTYRGLSTLGEPYHRADIHTMNHTRVTIGLHTYIINLNSEGR